MSFSFETKQELATLPNEGKTQSLAQCYGMLLFAKKFTYNEIIFTTENKFVNAKMTDLLMELFAPVTESSCGLKAGHSGHRLITTRVLSCDHCNRIFTAFGYNSKDFSLRINRANISDDTQLAFFLRGAFLSCGSVTDPEKGYHLEFKVPYRNLANDLLTLLCEIEQCNLKPKAVVRQGYYIVYFKDSEQIADFLTFIGAFNSSMSIMGTKAIKEVRNNAIRRVNSELHNIKKTADASARQIKAIKRLMKSQEYNTLSPELKEIAQLRLENPEMSLRALGELTSDGISRSGVNHRLKKLMSYTDEV
jgi:hypothetical protein